MGLESLWEDAETSSRIFSAIVQCPLFPQNIVECDGHVRFAPIRDIANLFDHFVGAGY
jgi:hypothetical protein